MPRNGLEKRNLVRAGDGFCAFGERASEASSIAIIILTSVERESAAADSLPPPIGIEGRRLTE